MSVELNARGTMRSYRLCSDRTNGSAFDSGLLLRVAGEIDGHGGYTYILYIYISSVNVALSVVREYMFRVYNTIPSDRTIARTHIQRVRQKEKNPNRYVVLCYYVYILCTPCRRVSDSIVCIISYAYSWSSRVVFERASAH